MLVWDAIGYTFRSPLVRIEGTLNCASYISGVLRPVDLPFMRFMRDPMLSTIMHNLMLPVLYRPSLILKMFDCCPGLHVHLIFLEYEIPVVLLPSD
ncbi:hypothetical protein TNCV_4275301 [Trichonephila clavipes]|nr:hypothetical protein TNCV_4275301 [Trichonephila clavipes]